MAQELAIVTEAQAQQVVASARRGMDGALSKLRLQSAVASGLLLCSFRKMELYGGEPPTVADAEWWAAQGG